MGVKRQIHLAGRRRQVYLGIKDANVVIHAARVGRLAGGHLNSMKGREGVALHLPLQPPPPPSSLERASVCETVNEFYALLVPFKEPAEPQKEEEIVAMQV